MLHRHKCCAVVCNTRTLQHCNTVTPFKADRVAGHGLVVLQNKSASAQCDYSLRAVHRLEFPFSSSTRHMSSFLCMTIHEWSSLSCHVVPKASLYVWSSYCFRPWKFLSWFVNILMYMLFDGIASLLAICTGQSCVNIVTRHNTKTTQYLPTACSQRDHFLN